MSGTRLTHAIPTGWNDAFLRALIGGFAAILTLIVKEWVETREWDLRACVIDGTWIAAGLLAANLILSGLSPTRRR